MPIYIAASMRESPRRGIGRTADSEVERAMSLSRMAVCASRGASPLEVNKFRCAGRSFMPTMRSTTRSSSARCSMRQPSPCGNAQSSTTVLFLNSFRLHSDVLSVGNKIMKAQRSI